MKLFLALVYTAQMEPTVAVTTLTWRKFHWRNTGLKAHFKTRHYLALQEIGMEQIMKVIQALLDIHRYTKITTKVAQLFFKLFNGLLLSMTFARKCKPEL